MSSVRITRPPGSEQAHCLGSVHTNPQFNPINPKPFLKTLVNKPIVVRLKWNKTEYKGTLISFDNYMNLQLEDTSEVVEGKEEKIGEIFIRCNNVLFIRDPSTATSAS